MAEENHFGIEREKKILKVGIREVFTPHQPINSVDLFFGRKAEVRSLLEQMNTPGQHSLLYGDRGVGKTSLANVAAIVLKELVEGRLYQKRCDSSDTFSSVLAAPLKDAGFDVRVSAIQRTKTTGGDLSLGVSQTKLALGGEKATMESLRGVDAQALSPAWVAEQLVDTPALFVVDESDAIPNGEDRKKLAELIKQLSDSASPFKVLVVGIADTAQQLTGGHPSVHRCLRETKLGRMSDGELIEIVRKGAERLGLSFSEHATQAIVSLSAGYPHFTHLLALKCAEQAAAADRTLVSLDDLEYALAAAAGDAEGTLKRQYDDAVRSYQTDMYKTVVGAAAQCTVPDFRAGELRRKIKERYNVDITQPALNNYLQRLVSEGDATILRRLSKGVYRFNDPRMPSYVRIAEGRIG